MARAWTVLVYVAGNNGKVFPDGIRLMDDLSAYARGDLVEMAQVGSSDDVAVLVQYDTLAASEIPRLYIEQGRARIIITLDTVNTGDPACLTDFIDWAADAYPADRYALVLWSHGTGWREEDVYQRYRRAMERAQSGDEMRAGGPGERLRNAFFLKTAGTVMTLEDAEERGICYDDASMDFLDNRELAAALDTASVPISLLGMDTCLMSMVEVAYQIREQAEVLVASQAVAPGTGWPYAAILQTMVDEPGLQPAALGRRIVQAYGDHYGAVSRGGGGQATLSAIDLAWLEPLGESVAHLSKRLHALYAQDLYTERAVKEARKRSQRFDDVDYVDLYDLIWRIGDVYDGDEDLLEATEAVLAHLAPGGGHAAILADVHVAQLGGAHGLSIYFPNRGCSQYYDDLEFARLGWGAWLRYVNHVG